MDESIDILQKDLVACTTHLGLQSAQVGMTTRSKTAGKKKEGIAVKYSKQQTDILMNWMIEHSDQPFPNQSDIAILMQQTGLTQSQVVNWTTNVRKRNRKATCEGGKKPHHFLDFLFLKKAREKDSKRKNLNVAPPPSRTPWEDRYHTGESPPTPIQSSTMIQPVHSHSNLYSIPEQVIESTEHLHFDDPVDLAIQNCDLEPLDVSDLQGQEMLSNFADFWLEDEPEETTVETFTPQPLLPSVTHDSQDQDKPIARHSSELEMMLEDEDIHSWAAQLGLTLDF
jgi:hypothetical protein